MIPRHKCERCSEYMQARYTPEGFVLICPFCEKQKERKKE